METRRFELADAKSSKFWEIGVQGTSLTIRFGRLGADGQTTTKRLASSEAARKQADKLVRAKTSKGYVECGPAERHDPTTPRIGWTKAVRDGLPPRRGDASLASLPALDEAKLRAKVTAAVKAIARAVKAGTKTSDASCRAAMHAAIEKPGTKSDPVVEGARAVLLGAKESRPKPEQAKAVAALIEWWIAAFGVPFAVEAMIEAARLGAWSARKALLLTGRNDRPDSIGTFIHGDFEPWHLLRRRVVAADDATYARARGVAAASRDGSGFVFRCALSFVFPDEEKWARETWKESDRPAHIAYCGRPLVTCFRDAKTVSRFVEHGPHYRLLAHAVDVMGPSAFAPLKKLFTHHGLDARQRTAILAAMALIESPQVAKFFLPLTKDKKIGGVVESYFARRPDLFAFARD